MPYSKIERAPGDAPTKEFSLTEIRLLYLKGVLPWDIYQHFEKAMTVQFADYHVSKGKSKSIEKV